MKIVGYTVGTPLPKPNFDQTDPHKGDFIKGDRSFITPDDTLTESGRPADAQATGLAITEIHQNLETKADVSAIPTKLSDLTDDSNFAQTSYVDDKDAAMLTEANEYTDEKIALLMNNSSTAVDSIMELAAAMEENEDVVAAINESVGKKADKEHAHDDKYYTEQEIDSKLNLKADVSTIPTSLSQLSDDGTNRLVTDAEKVVWNNKSDFSGNYNDLTNKPSIPSIEGLATSQYVNDQLSDINGKLNNKSDSGHNHNDLYYGKLEVDSKLGGKSDTGHDHDDVYYTETEIDVKVDTLNSAISGKADAEHDHTIDDVTGLQSALDQKSNSGHTHTASDVGAEPVGAIDTHNTNESTHNDIRALINDLTERLNAIADSDDTTLDQLSEIVTYIKNNKSLIDGVTTSKVNVADIVDDLTTNVNNKPLSAAQGVAVKNSIDSLQAEFDAHNHIVADITDLTATATELNYMDGVTSSVQAQLDSKAASSHGIHVSYSTTAPVVAGTAAVGTETTVSRSDHVHPAQTTVSGNAGTATKLQTARTIDGVSFDGSAAITHYGTCSTAAATAAKTVACTGFTLVTGASIKVRFTVTNTAAVADLTLNVNSTGAKSIKYRNANLGSAGYLAANRTYEFVYDGTYYQVVGDIDTNTTNVGVVNCTTAAGTAAKVGSANKYSLANNRYFMFNLSNANSYAGAITLNINSAGAKPIYINGSASSADNYTLPAGMYFVYYNGTNYYFRTDSSIQANIAGNATGLSSTLSVSKGGTGATTFTSGAALIGAGTGAVTTRAITNLTAKGAITGSTNLATANSVLYHAQNRLNRTTSVDTADTSYSTYMARGIAAGTSDLTAGSSSLTNGCIYFVYE